MKIRNTFNGVLAGIILLSCFNIDSIHTGGSPDGIAGNVSYIGGGTGGTTSETGGIILETGGTTGGTNYNSGTSGVVSKAGSAGNDIDSTGGTEGGEGAVGGTVDLGTGGEGNTIDIGTGGTIDLGTGGTVDLGTGGSIDLGTGGSVDLGTGGTTDICITECIPDVLGYGEDAVNLLVFENAVASGCDTEGRMWVGGDANLSGYGVGQQLTECDTEVPVLVVGGDLSANGGIKGKIWVGGEILSGTPQCGGIWSDPPPPVDFLSLKETLIAYSVRLSEYTANGTTAIGTPTVFSGTDLDMNIFSISGADMLSSNGFRFDVPIESTVIVNISGASGGFVNGSTELPDNTVCGSGAVSLNDFCNKIVWNFYEAESISVSGTAVQGSILAPLAAFESNGSGQVNGTVIVNSFEIDNCVEMHPHYFNGCLCTETGEYACCV